MNLGLNGLSMKNISMAEKSKLQQVGFRLPEKLVNKIDSEAEKNYRDRTGEIIHALVSYYDLEAEKEEIINIIDKMSKKIEVLEKEVQGLKE